MAGPVQGEPAAILVPHPVLRREADVGTGELRGDVDVELRAIGRMDAAPPFLGAAVDLGGCEADELTPAGGESHPVGDDIPVPEGVERGAGGEREPVLVDRERVEGIRGGRVRLPAASGAGGLVLGGDRVCHGGRTTGGIRGEVGEHLPCHAQLTHEHTIAP